jgi:hypothetical protein
MPLFVVPHAEVDKLAEYHLFLCHLANMLTCIRQYQ